MLVANAQEELLPDGAYGVTVHGGIKAGESKAYSLTAEEGQVFKAHVFTRGVEKGATLELLNSEGESLLGELSTLIKIDTLDLVLPKNDKYELKVLAGKSTCSYILEVTLEEPTEKPKGRTRGEPEKNDPTPPEPIEEEQPPAPTPSPAIDLDTEPDDLR